MKLALNPNYSRKSLESMYITNTCIYTHAHTLTHTHTPHPPPPTLPPHPTPPPPPHTHTHYFKEMSCWILIKYLAFITKGMPS